MLKIVVDTREKKPYTFKGHIIKRRALESGDYSLLGYTKKIIIERKSLADLFGTITVKKNLIRFTKELERLRKIPYWFILVDASPTSISKGFRHSRANGFATLCFLFELIFKYNGRILFAKSRDEASMLIEAMFNGFIEAQKN